MRRIELSLLKACPVLCSYCPQDLLKKASRGVVESTSMSSDTLRAVLDNASEGEPLGVYFAGFTEPLIHPGVMDLMQQAVDHESTKLVQIHSTGDGLREGYARRLRDMNATVAWHASPQAKGSLYDHLDEIREYLPYSTFTFVGKASRAAVNKLSGLRVVRTRKRSRAGNLLNDPEPGAYPVTCKKVGRRKMPVVLPDGKCSACCNDYGLTLMVGDLTKHTWSELNYAAVLQKQSDPGCGAICHTDCHFARKA